MEQPATLVGKNLDSPDETRQFVDKGRMDIVELGGATVGRAVFEPGWKWSEHVRPIAGTDTCQVPHVAYIASGRLKIVMDDGTETEVGPGDAVTVAPGHDAWTIGDEACVWLEFSGAAQYAKE